MIISLGRTWRTVAFLTPWTLVTLVFDAVTALMSAGWMAGGVSLALFMVLFLLPFNAIAIGSWVTLVADLRDRRSVAGVGRPKHSRDRWNVTLPGGGTFAVVMVLFLLPILGVFGLIFALRAAPPPLWGTLTVLGVCAAAATWAYRYWGFRPTVVIDEKKGTVTFRTRRGEAGDTALWSAVKWIDVVERRSYDSEADSDWIVGYDVRVKLEGKGGTRFVQLPGRSEREPVEVFARWLRQHIGMADG